MRLLILCIAAVTLAVTGCGPAAPVTVDDAWREVSEAYRNGDARALLALLDAKSLARVREAARVLNSMNTRQKAWLSSQGLAPDPKGGVTPEVYMRMALAMEKGSHVYRGITAGMSRHEIRGKQARAWSMTGMAFDFMQEGPYWRFVLPGTAVGGPQSRD